jgi:grpE
MSNKDKNTIEEDDILENIEEEIEQMEKDEESEKPSEASQSPEVDKTKDILTKTLADFDNYKKRVERDKKDMIFFLKSDILKKILPRVDDLERIIKNTPKDFQENIVFE